MPFAVWHEDPIRIDSLDLLKQYARDCEALICASETLSYKWGFKDYLQTGVAGVAMLSWCGGLSEARKIAAMADAWQLPVAPHDCTGPVVWSASAHLSLHAPNALIPESVREFYTGWYRELVTELPLAAGGMITLADRPGSDSNCCPICIGARMRWSVPAEVRCTAKAVQSQYLLSSPDSKTARPRRVATACRRPRATAAASIAL